MSLSDRERVALYAYTTRKGKWAGPKLNQALRDDADGVAPLPPHYAAYRDTLLAALARLPDQAGIFWRGIVLDATQQALYQPGSIVPWPAFSSTSRRESGAYSGNTRFTFHGRRGKDIRAYSADPSEDEVLFRAGMRVRVLRPPRERDGVLYIEIEEVDDGQATGSGRHLDRDERRGGAADDE